MHIKIGERSLAIIPAGDLDAALVAATGCTAAEQATMLRGGATAFQVARVLHAVIAGDEAPAIAELVETIDGDGLLAVCLGTIALLAGDEQQEQPDEG